MFHNNNSVTFRNLLLNPSDRFSPKRVAEARARNRGGDGDDVPVTTVASEMEKFIPFIRIRIMTLSEFRIVMDASHLLPPEAVVDPIRFFTATYSEEKYAS